MTPVHSYESSVRDVRREIEISAQVQVTSLAYRHRIEKVSSDKELKHY